MGSIDVWGAETCGEQRGVGSRKVLGAERFGMGGEDRRPVLDFLQIDTERVRV